MKNEALRKSLIESPSIFNSFLDLYRGHKEDTFLSFPLRGENSVVTISRGLAISQISKLASVLYDLGVRKGSRVGIISNSRAEWILSDMAILSLGAISVSIYQSLTPKEIAYILFDSQAEFIFLENQEQANKIEEITSKEWPIAATEDRVETSAKIFNKGIICFEALEKTSLNVLQYIDIVSGVTIEPPPKIELSRSDIASIVYTSGTTGPPKGVVQTHENHLSNVRQVLDSGLILPNSSIYLFLPLAHSFARLMAYIAALNPISLTLPEVSDNLTSKVKPQNILRDMAVMGSSIIPIVPRFLEKMKDQLETESAKRGIQNKLIKATLWSRIGNGRDTLIGSVVKILTTAVRNRIVKKLFGSSFKYCISGGAKLSPSVHSFFDALDIIILEGYGLTETVVATNACTLEKRKIGSVGPVLADDIQVKIAADGEILFKGPNIFSSYLNRPTATKKAFSDDGWFLTGDLGRVDESGFLYVEGRKKDLIITSGGKNIAPLAIEEKIMSSVLVSQAVLFGDGRKYCASLITLNPASVKEILGIDLSLVPDPNQNKVILDAISKHISNINKDLASYETIKKFYLIKEDFTIESGLLTPSMKVKKKEVESRYKKEIDSLF